MFQITLVPVIHLAVLSLLLGACVPSPEDDARTTPSAAVSAADSTAADRRAVDTLRQRYNAAWLDGERESILSLFTEDALLLADGLPAVDGREAIATFYWPADGSPSTVTHFTSSSRRLEVSGDLAYDQGTYVLAFALDGVSEPVSTAGDYIAVARRQEDGLWRWALYGWTAH